MTISRSPGTGGTASPDRPLVYACSGCSNVAQLANDAAVALDRSGYAEMSCIAGVGGGVPRLVRVAQSGRRIIAIDGCPLHCVRSCLGNAGVQPDHHFVLTRLGLRKRYGEDCDGRDLARLVTVIRKAIHDSPPRQGIARNPAPGAVAAN